MMRVKSSIVPSVILILKRCWQNGARWQEYCLDYEHTLLDGHDNRCITSFLMILFYVFIQMPC